MSGSRRSVEIYEHYLYSRVMVEARWKPEAGRVVMKAMLAGLWPKEYQRGVEALVEVRGLVDNPEETIVSQQAGSSLPPPEIQSAPIFSSPNPEGNDDGLYASYAQVKTAAGNKGTAEISRSGSDEEPHVVPSPPTVRVDWKWSGAGARRGTARLKRWSDGYLHTYGFSSCGQGRSSTNRTLVE